MAYSSKTLAQLAMQICVENDIINTVISPGSRNAPLIISFTENKNMNCFSIVDERCAAFFALGMAQQLQKPVVLFCTSGSALLNYYPAIAEAFYSHIPLIVVSADRPADKIDIADGQTIRQENVFANHSLYNANLFEDDNRFDDNFEALKKALQTAIIKKGPVHINMPFEEPLYNQISNLSFSKTLDIKLDTKSITIKNTRFKAALRSWNLSVKKMILIGVCQPNKALNTALIALSKDPSVIVLTETTSNLYHKDFINTIDNLIFSLSDNDLAGFQPDCLITLGGMVVSKRIKQFLRKFKPEHHWHISKLNAPDTYFCLSGQVHLASEVFFNRLLANKKEVKSHFKSDWLIRKQVVETAHNQFISSVDYSDLAVFNKIIKNLPKQINLQLSNSSVIRYAQLFHIDQSINVFCNRGTSGIDGSTSTAIGAAVKSDRPTIFVTGDLSFFYDSNALWNRYIPNNFKIILINNKGGGIFRILSGPQTTEALDYFEAPHQFTGEQLCNMYKIDYKVVNNLDGLKSVLPSFMINKKGPSLLEIQTPSALNDKILKGYFKILS